VPSTKAFADYVAKCRESNARCHAIWSKYPRAVGLYSQYAYGVWGRIRAGSIPPLGAILEVLPEHERQPFTDAWNAYPAQPEED